MFSDADLDAMYASLGETVSRASGAPDFIALRSVADVDAFDTGTVSEHRIRYRSTTTLVAGEQLDMDGVTYRVSRAVPRRINDGREIVADLVPA